MRVALVSDAWQAAGRGNGTTVRRWQALLPDVVEAVAADASPELSRPPDIVHGYHVLRGGLFARSLARKLGVPYVVGLGGTDLAALIFGTDRSDAVAEGLRGAALVTGAFESFARWLPGTVPYRVVPRSVDASESLDGLRPPDGRVFALLPSGLRPEKDILYAIRLARELRGRGVPLHLTILGFDLDREYAVAVRREIQAGGGVDLKALPGEMMDAAYRSSDVVWNTSLHEGGANAVLEGVARGNALFLRDVPGNREWFESPLVPGALYRGEIEQATRFHLDLAAESVQQRAERRLAGFRWLRERHRPSIERDALLDAWGSVLASQSPD